MSPPASERAEQTTRDVRTTPHVAPQPRGADGAARHPYHHAKQIPTGTVALPKKLRQRDLTRSPSGPSRNWLTVPTSYGIDLPAMRTIQMRNAGAARGHYGRPKLMKPERAMESAGNREAEILTTDATDEHGLEMGAETHKPRKAELESIRLASLILAYLRLTGKKLLRQRMVNSDQACKMQGKPR